MSAISNPVLHQILDTYNVGDARQLFQSLPKHEFVDVTITSPPYWNLKDYGTKKQIGFGQSYEDCLSDLTDVFRSVYSITKPSGSLWIVADTIKDDGKLRLFPFDLAAKLQVEGWVLHDIIVWNKDKTLPWSHRGKLRNIFEYVLFFSKSKEFNYYLSSVRDIDDLKEWWVKYPERYSPFGKAPSRTWSIPIPRQGSWGENWVRHYCPLPPELVRRMILLTTKPGDVVLDTFSGSGVVLAQAAAMKRRYVGLDISRKYRSVFLKQVFPSLQKLEVERSRTCAAGTDRRKLFEKSIWTLRKLKVARELQRLYESKHGKLKTSLVLVFAKEGTAVRVSFIFSGGLRGVDKMMYRLSQLLLRPPLSKYELKIELRAVRQNGRPPEVVVREFGKQGQLYLFKNGVTSKAVGKIRLESIFAIEKGNGAVGRSRFAPILSNIEPDSLLASLR
jgi:DNA modification methylase